MSRPVSVLLAEDEALIRQMLARVLERCGFRVSLASDGVEALELFRDRVGETDVLVLDVRMPNLDGPKALAAMRALRPEIPAILMSGHDIAAADAGLLPKGVRFMTKPFTGAVLMQAIKEMTSREA